MKKIVQKCFLGAVGFVIISIMAMGIFLVAQPDIAHALQDTVHLVTVLYRVDGDLLRPTPYGQYYSDLYWKHNDELIRIFQSHPEAYANAIDITNLYIPHLERLLDGHGDDVHISQGQVDELQTMLDWLQSVSSEELKADIEREEARTPLQELVGMTMNEALLYVQSAWERDFSPR